MSGSSASTPVARRPSVVVTVAVVVALALLLPARGRAQAPLGSTTIQLLGVYLQVAPGVATLLRVPLNTAIPLGTQLTRGDCTTSPAGNCTVLDPATVFGTPLGQVHGRARDHGEGSPSQRPGASLALPSPGSTPVHGAAAAHGGRHGRAAERDRRGLPHSPRRVSAAAAPVDAEHQRELGCTGGNAEPGERMRPILHGRRPPHSDELPSRRTPRCSGSTCRRRCSAASRSGRHRHTPAALVAWRSPFARPYSRTRPRCGAAPLGRREPREVEREAAPPAFEGVPPRILQEKKAATASAKARGRVGRS